MKEDIRPLKSKLREYYRTLRQNIPSDAKEKQDSQITQRVTGLWQYRKSRLILTYVSTNYEVDTKELIKSALADGKQVAVPRCIDGTHQMEFFRITGLHELFPGAFGVLEPAPQAGRKVTNYTNSLCLVPALCYDWKGYRLGYGKGYYDRFLDGYHGTIAGIAYSSCVRRSLPYGRFDRPVELLVTERYIRRNSRRINYEYKVEAINSNI